LAGFTTGTPGVSQPDTLPRPICRGRRVVAERVCHGVDLSAAIPVSWRTRPPPTPARVRVASAFTEASVMPTRGCGFYGARLSTAYLAALAYYDFATSMWKSLRLQMLRAASDPQF
jgi:hypothetical protein